MKKIFTDEKTTEPELKIGTVRDVVVVICLSFTLGMYTNVSGQDYSLVVGVDGLGSYGLYVADTPNLDSLVNGTFGGGAYQGALAQHSFVGGILNTETQQITSSGPGWSSNLAGVWVDKHNVTDNGFGSPNFSDHPCYLETLSENVGNIYLASAITWSPIDTHIISTVDDGNSSMDFRITGSDASNTTAAVDQILSFGASNPAALFVHLDDVDGEGHGSGSYSANYHNEITEVDSQIGQMLIAIQSRANFANENWQIIITADHGHKAGGGHGGQSEMERTVPLIVTSKTSTAQGFVPSSAGHSPSIVDVSPTVLNHFGLASQPNYEGIAIGGTALSISTSSLVSNGLVSHMSFEGDTSAGLAGNGGTVNGSIQFAVGKFGDAAKINSYGDGFIRLNDDLDAQFGQSTDFSVSFWVEFDSFSGDPAFMSNKDWNSGSNTGFNLAYNPSNTLDFNTKANSGAREDVHPYECLRPGQWQNIVFTVDRDGKTMLYCDGTLMGAIESTSSGSFDTQFNWVLMNDGTGTYPGSVSGLMIDEFCAWNRLLTLDEITILSQLDLAPVQTIVVDEAGGQTFATAQLLPTPDVGINLCVANGVSGDAILIGSGVVSTIEGSQQFFTLNGATPDGVFTLAATPAVPGENNDATGRQYNDASFSNEIFFDDDDGPGLYPEFREGEVFADTNGDVHLSIGEFGDDAEITVSYDVLDVSSATSFDDYFRVAGLVPGSVVTVEVLSDGMTYGFFDSVLHIFDRFETELGTVDDGSPGPNIFFGPPLSVNVPSDGIVVILVENFDTHPGGTYKLRVVGSATGGGGTVVADSLNVFRGLQIGGDLSDTFESDDLRMRFNPGLTLTSSEAPVWLIFDASLPSDIPNSLNIVLESSAGTPGLTAALDVFNWNTNAYDVVDQSAASFNNDEVVTVDLSAGIRDYVQAGTGAVRTRIGWRKTGLTLNFPWEVRLDQIVWNFN